MQTYEKAIDHINREGNIVAKLSERINSIILYSFAALSLIAAGQWSEPMAPLSGKLLGTPKHSNAHTEWPTKLARLIPSASMEPRLNKARC